MIQSKKGQSPTHFVRSLMILFWGIGFSLTVGTPLAMAEYPEKEITIIVPWAAGGGTDLIARFMGDLMEKDLGKPVVVVNKPGGGGLVGFNQIAAAKLAVGGLQSNRRRQSGWLHCGGNDQFPDIAEIFGVELSGLEGIRPNRFIQL